MLNQKIVVGYSGAILEHLLKNNTNKGEEIMFTLTEEQRKQLLQYMWARPYGEVATHIAMLASLKPNKPESKDDKPKKDLS